MFNEQGPTRIGGSMWRWLFAMCAALAALSLLLAACTGGDDEPTDEQAAMAMDEDEEDEHAGMAMDDEEDDEHAGMAMDDEEDDEHAGMAMDDEEDDEHAGMAMDDEEDDHSGAHVGVAAGVVHPKPDGATEVGMILSEWKMTPTVTTVPAGMVYFLATTAGPIHTHELAIVRTDLPPDQLPTIGDGSAGEEGLEVVGRIPEFAIGTQASGVFHLEAGSYVLICNLVVEDGDQEAHYEEGMHLAFKVE